MSNPIMVDVLNDHGIVNTWTGEMGTCACPVHQGDYNKEFHFSKEWGFCTTCSWGGNDWELAGELGSANEDAGGCCDFLHKVKRDRFHDNLMNQLDEMVVHAEHVYISSLESLYILMETGRMMPSQHKAHNHTLWQKYLARLDRINTVREEIRAGVWVK